MKKGKRQVIATIKVNNRLCFNPFQSGNGEHVSNKYKSSNQKPTQKLNKKLKKYVG